MASKNDGGPAFPEHAHFMIGVPVVDDPNELIDICEVCGLSAEEIQTPVISTNCGTLAEDEAFNKRGSDSAKP